MTQRIVPMVAYEDAAAAIEWLCDAFGFAENEAERHTDESGAVTHAELERDGAIIMVATPSPDYRGPKRHRETCEASRRWQDNPWVIDGLFVDVDDIDAHHTRAVKAGATILRPLGDVDFTGMRRYTAEDPEGHRWMFGQPAAEPEAEHAGATLPG